ncbi:MAG: sugar phosphate isomerase/epimerase [Planctomycetes bacterium]|nr:sugar phosphate isomerase/epimerase [Planctomycetota bacterium]
MQLALGPVILEPAVWGAAIGELRREGIEIVSGMMAMSGEDYSSLESIARTAGVRLDDTWPANRAHAEAVASLAADEGLDLVTFHGGFIPEDRADPERAKLLERLRTVADIFASHQLRLGFETGQETAQTLVEALDDLDRPNIGVNFDPANMILYGKGDPIEALRLLGPHVVQVHVKDAVPTTTPGTWGTEVPVGDGAVDWQAFFEVALTIDPPVNFIIEREAGADPSTDIPKARDLIQTYVGSSPSHTPPS